MKINKVDVLLDGGSIAIDTDEGLYFIDYKAHSVTNGCVYIGKPLLDKSNMIKNDYVFKKRLYLAIDKYKVINSLPHKILDFYILENKNNKYKETELYNDFEKVNGGNVSNLYKLILKDMFFAFNIKHIKYKTALLASTYIIIKYIFNDNNKLNDEDKSQALSLFNINLFYDKICEFYRILPTIEHLYENIDCEAFFLNDLCEDYIDGLIKKIKL